MTRLSSESDPPPENETQYFTSVLQLPDTTRGVAPTPACGVRRPLAASGVGRTSSRSSRPPSSRSTTSASKRRVSTGAGSTSGPPRRAMPSSTSPSSVSSSYSLAPRSMLHSLLFAQTDRAKLRGKVSFCSRDWFICSCCKIKVSRSFAIVFTAILPKVQIEYRSEVKKSLMDWKSLAKLDRRCEQD